MEILAHVLGGSVRPNNLLHTKNPVCKASVASFWVSGVEAGRSGHFFNDTVVSTPEKTQIGGAPVLPIFRPVYLVESDRPVSAHSQAILGL